jgi:hypothetical protein
VALWSDPGSDVSGRALIAISLAALVIMLFLATADCRAANRTRTLCRNNARGLLGSCHLQQHKRQNLLFAVFAARKRKSAESALQNKFGELWSSPRQLLDTVGAVVALGSALLGIAATVAGLR